MKDFNMKIVRWIIAGSVVVLVILVALTAAVLFLVPESITGPTIPPLQLPALDTKTTSASAVSADGN